jgi:hypothetical protein
LGSRLIGKLEVHSKFICVSPATEPTRGVRDAAGDCELRSCTVAGVAADAPDANVAATATAPNEPSADMRNPLMCLPSSGFDSAGNLPHRSSPKRHITGVQTGNG